LLFITGTDTGAGKTLLTALLLNHLRAAGRRALAVKPLATGSTADADLLDALQASELPRTLLNPFFFWKPVAPLVAARTAGRSVRLPAVIDRLRAAAARCDLLLVEGCGGLLTPLGERFNLLDLACKMPGAVVVAAQNRLGVINHVLLTHTALQAAGAHAAATVLMGVRSRDASTTTNASVIRAMTPGIPVIECPYLGRVATRPAAVRKAAARLDRPLSLLADLAFGPT